MAAPIATTTVTQPMTTDVLTLSQLLSPSFPVGAFAYAHGLETAIDDGAIHDVESLQVWLLDLLDHGGANADAVLLNIAYRSDDPLIDATARAFAASSERLMETDLQGAARLVAHPRIEEASPHAEARPVSNATTCPASIAPAAALSSHSYSPPIDHPHL